MPIYSNNSYSPLGSIQAALNNLNERNRIKNEYWKNKGQIWSNFAKDMGSMGGRLVDAFQAQQESPEARLAALEQERNEALEAERIQGIQDSYNDQVAQRQAVDNYLNNTPEALASRYAEAMRGYRPNFEGYNYNQYQGGTYPEQEMEDFYRRGI